MPHHLHTDLAGRIVEALGALEAAFRRLHPLAIPRLRDGLRSRVEGLEASLLQFSERGVPDADAKGLRLLEAGGLVLEALHRFGGGDDMTQAFMAVLRSMRSWCRTQEVLYPLSRDFPEIDRFFLEPGAIVQRGKNGEIPESSTGIVHRIPGEDAYGRGGYSLFVPGFQPSGRPLALVVALHGGYGHGRDFLWTWLREARSRGLLLMAPSSAGSTWSLADIETDAVLLEQHLAEVCSRYAVDRSRILLTGMSDGGTFALGFGLRRGSPASAVAPVSCVLPPVGLEHAGGRRIFWVHGAQDWMFPAGRAARACEELSRAGAEVRLKIVPDLAHAYPREENSAILGWFAPDPA
jgi:phospholipase/carboxylesterase